MKFQFVLLLVILFSCKENKSLPAASNTNAYYEKAWFHMDQNNKDSAFAFLNKAKIEFAKNKDSIGMAKCMLNMAIIQADYGDFMGSQENAVGAVKIFERANDNDYLSTNYNLLGTNEQNLKNYEVAVLYLKEAASKTNIKPELEIIQNNLAITYAKQKQYDSALAIFQNLLKENAKNAMIIDNSAFIKWKKDSSYNAEPEMLAALKIREKESQLLGQNASHAHLSDYFSKKNPALALYHAREMYQVALKAKSPPDQLEALQKLISLENGENAKQYFKIYQKVDDSLQTARNKVKNQFAMIRYDSEKNRAAFLNAQAENAEKNYHILQQYIALGIAVCTIISGVFWYRRRKKRVEQENQLKIKKTELKYSKKVHDVVANGVYQVMTEVENQENLDKEALLDKLEIIYEKSRDISYDDAMKSNEENYSEKIAHLLQSFSSSHTQIIIIGNNETVWENLSQPLKEGLIIVLQELLVNMKKHSSAQKVSLRFEKDNDFICIFYFDDGVGLPKNNFNLKNGLQNTVNRISSFDGIVTFDTETEKGTKINIQLPFDKK